MPAWSKRSESPTSTKTRLRRYSTSRASSTSPLTTRCNTASPLCIRKAPVEIKANAPGVFSDWVPPAPDPGEADQLLPLKGHLSDCLQPPGFPRETLVRGDAIYYNTSAPNISTHSIFCITGLHVMIPLCWRILTSRQLLISIKRLQRR